MARGHDAPPKTAALCSRRVQTQVTAALKVPPSAHTANSMQHSLCVHACASRHTSGTRNDLRQAPQLGVCRTYEAKHYQASM